MVPLRLLVKSGAENARELEQSRERTIFCPAILLPRSRASYFSCDSFIFGTFLISKTSLKQAQNCEFIWFAQNLVISRFLDELVHSLQLVTPQAAPELNMIV